MKDISQLHTDLFVGGAWRPGAAGARFDVINPHDESVIATVASAEVADGMAALDAAEAAFGPWAATTPRHRSEVLRRAFDLMTARAEDLARVISLENGKARGDAMGEAKYSAEFFRWFSEEAVRNEGTNMHAPASGARIVTHHKPAGIALLVTPWNFPASMATRKMAPALAAGCPVIAKPAPQTPLTMQLVAEILVEAGVPEGLVSVLPTTKSAELVGALMQDPRVRVISFTGSTAVGRTLLRQAADQVMIPAMELGGNAPVIVCHDADLQTAVDGTMLAKMRNIGEACTAANRIYVHDSLHDAFVEAIVARMSALRAGDQMDPATDVGPLIDQATRDKVHRHVQDAVAKGATLRLGGVLPEGPGFHYPTTVLTDVPAGATCMAEEIFGPVAAIQRFTDEDDAVARANDTTYGLVSYVFTEDYRRGLKLCERMEAGMVGLNRGLVSDPAAPFGGVKQSGLGREGGHDGMHEFTETQYISLDL